MTSRLVRQTDLTETELSEMHALMTAHFEGVTVEQFRKDAAEKNWAILLERDGRLVGFSTILAYETTFDGQPVSVIYSGDTIVDPEAWGSSALPRAWIAAVNELRRHYPRGRYYWMLITSGFRTYRFLPLFWREFFPRYDARTPENTQRLLDALARERFGERYDPSAGIVRFARPQKLREHLRGVQEGRLNDLHVAFFVSKNPGHADGDELVCLTELSEENLTRAGRRMVGR